MIKIIFDALERRYENPSVELLRDYIFNKGDELWAGGSGQGGIDFYENDKRKSLIHLSALEEYGFYVEHMYWRSNEPMHTLIAGEHTGEKVEIYIGGNPELHWREQFVPKEMVWEAVEYFLQTGECKPSLRWVVPSEIASEEMEEMQVA